MAGLEEEIQRQSATHAGNHQSSHRRSAGEQITAARRRSRTRQCALRTVRPQGIQTGGSSIHRVQAPALDVAGSGGLLSRPGCRLHGTGDPGRV
jgi:hypothetical protein